MVLAKLSITLITSVAIGYLVAARGNATTKGIFLLATWLVFLGIPTTASKDELPLKSFLTLAMTSLAFMVPLKLTQAVLFPHLQAKDASKDNAKPDKKISEELSLRNLAAFAGDVLFYLMPVSKSKKKPSGKEFIKTLLHWAIWIPIKMVLAVALHLVIVELLKDDGDPVNISPSLYSKLLVLFCFLLLTSSWQQDIQAVFVHCLTGGRYEMLPFHEYALLSTSLKNFWGKRYNRLVNHLLTKTVYIPAQNEFGYSKRAARYLAFFVSGILHIYIAHFSFVGRGRHVRSLLFFVLQPIWMDLEEHLKLPAGRTHMFFFLSAVLYVGLFVEAMPEWMKINVPDPIHPLVDEYLAPKVAEYVTPMIYALYGER